ncbi:NAD(P)/FAD-dependent oxidoreductase [Clostridia bacterium OttesenSCG-928-F22]|nr:NAD(P)/FAD-dependent oxidoreductase [Clostridia bacterium OttesenSCG-928-F22]
MKRGPLYGKGFRYPHYRRGVVGSAIARELSRYRLSIAVLEQHPDILLGTSGRNSGVLHAGFNNKPGSKMAQFCVAGNAYFDTLAKELSIPYKRTGKLVVGFDKQDYEALMRMKETGEANGIEGLALVDTPFIRNLAPSIRGDFALWSPTTAILSPFQLTIGLAESAIKNGVRYFLRHKVTGIAHENNKYTVQAGGRQFTGRWLVNAAGLGAVEISAMLGVNGYTMYPCRGEYFILDENLGPMLPLPAYPVPNPKEGGLGIHLTPTVDGNILIGPSSEYIAQADDYACTKHTMDLLLKDGSRIFPHIKREHFIRNFAGMRPKLTGEGGYMDFVIEKHQQAIHLLGIESPGLTSAIPLAREVIRLIAQTEELPQNPYFDPLRPAITTFHDKTPEQQAQLIRTNADYGEIICRCGGITKAEVLEALHNPLGVITLTGIKYRCRTMMGRCQGGYCQTRIAELIMQETGQHPEQVEYNYEHSHPFTGEVRHA